MLILFKVYCQTYYASAIRILKEFDETAAADLTTAQGFLEAVRIKPLWLDYFKEIMCDNSLL